MNNFELYNPVLNTWTAEPSLPSPVYGAAGVVDSNSNLDLIGGFGSSGAAVTSVISTPVTAGTTILPQPPTVTVQSQYYTFNGSPESVTATAVGTDGSTPVAGSFSFTYNGSATLPTNAGTYSVIALFTSADAGYVDGAADGTLVIYTATPTVQANGGGTFTYNGQPHSISATALGVDGVTPVAGTFSYTYNGLSTAPTTWGTYTAVAAFTPTDPNYSSSTASTTITIPDPRIVTGVSVTGVSTTSLKVSWNPVIEPTGATPTYTVYEQLWHNGTHSPKGSGGTPGYYYYTQVGSNISGSSLTISGLATANGYSGSHTYTVVSVDNSTTPATVSAYSALGTGSPEFAPSVPDTLLGGALVSQASVEIGHSVQISPLYYGNPSPTFTLTGAPSSMSINPSTGLVTYSPVKGESGTVSVQIVATNVLGTSSIPFAFVVIQQPTVQVTGGTFAYDGNVHPATAVALDNNGQPIAGTFSFAYAPIQYPTSFSSSPYAEPGTYLVQATFTSSTAGYGTATGSGQVTITESSYKTISFPGPLGKLSLDSTGTLLNIWGDINGGTPFTEQIPLSSYTQLGITGSYLGTNLTIDLTNGNPIPSGGIIYTGSGWASTNSINIVDDSTNNDTVVSANGELEVNGNPIVYSLTGSVTFTSAATTDLSVTSGSFHIPAGTSGAINTRNFSNITIGAGASLIADNASTHAGRTLIDTTTLSIAGTTGAWTGALDLGGNDLVVANGDPEQISNQIASGYANGTWLGTGITSSVAANDATYLTALGTTQNVLGNGRLYGADTSLGLFDGQDPSSGAVLVKYTYYGDTDLNGQIDGTDYGRIDNGYIGSTKGWVNGDLNYDGVVDGSDYTLMDNAFNSQGASLAAVIATAARPVGTATPTAQVFQTQSPITLGDSSDSADLLTAQKDVLDQLAIG